MATLLVLPHHAHRYNQGQRQIFFPNQDLIKENLDPTELAANDFGKRYAGNQDTYHEGKQRTKTLSLSRYICQVS